MNDKTAKIVVIQFVWSMLHLWKKENIDPRLGVRNIFYAFSKLALEYPEPFAHWDFYILADRIKCNELDVLLDRFDKVSHHNIRHYLIKDLPDIKIIDDSELDEAYSKFKRYLFDEISIEHLS